MQPKMKKPIWAVTKAGELLGFATGKTETDAFVKWGHGADGATITQWMRVPVEITTAIVTEGVEVTIVGRKIGCIGCEWDMDDVGKLNPNPEAKNLPPAEKVVDKAAHKAHLAAVEVTQPKGSQEQIDELKAENKALKARLDAAGIA